MTTNTENKCEDTRFMGEALAEARKCFAAGDVPIGAVIVKDGEVIARGRNTRERDGRATGHAELVAIEEACDKLGGWRLSGCTLYVTLEPCPMCAGAIVNSRISRVVYAAKDAKAGAFGSVLNFNSYPLNHKVAIDVGVSEKEAKALLPGFFASLRG